ncbi:MAG: prepilin peptidase, partial [Patescibacteria group bacterium]|nr:prepilin peptidase [Patescibacteria group bacterium]
ILFFIFLFGLIIGSFLNCLIYRIHEGKSVGGRSFCPHCKQQIAWYDNLPVLSFVLLKGKCRHCRKRISWQYPAVELMTGILFVISFLLNSRYSIQDTNFQFSIFNFQTISNIQYPISIFFTSNFLLLTLRDFFLVSVMIIIFIYDLRWYLILDKITLPAAGIVLILNILLGFSLWNLLISGIIGGSFFLFQFLISKGKWIGGGDIRLGFLMGVALGWKMLLLALFLAYILGSIIGISLIISNKKKWGSQIPFGVFLSVATIVVLFWGDKLLGWYLNLFY